MNHLLQLQSWLASSRLESKEAITRREAFRPSFLSQRKVLWLNHQAGAVGYSTQYLQPDGAPVGFQFSTLGSVHVELFYNAGLL